LDLDSLLNIITAFITTCLFPLIVWILSKQFNLENRLSVLEGKVDIIIRYINGFAETFFSNPNKGKQLSFDPEEKKEQK